ncbi:MAG: iron-containing alcohol dehydrogenase family protein [Candidatus Melainabacteria bacterium]|nr:iron-containing alcohol dehydrogenase family protein [Candidatus Melainabacteria bacterium]
MNTINVPHNLCILNSNKEVADKLINFINEEGFSKVALITTKTPNYLITNELEVALLGKVEKLKTFQVINASIAYVNQLSLVDFDIVVGVGGGKVIDTAKYAAHINNIPCISIPTSISNDGICSPVAVLKEKQNKYKSLGATIPIALFVPLHLIEKSDEESIISGVGDLLSNLSAVEDCKLANIEANEYIDDYAVMVSKHAAQNVFCEIENYILQRKTREQFLKENLNLVIESLALSGIAMEIAGTSRPASGAEHLISHAIDELFGDLKQHGAQVAFGTYIATFLRAELDYIQKNNFEELKVVLRFMGLPTTLPMIGLTKEQLIEVIIHAPQTRPDRFTILNKIRPDKDYISQVLDRLFTHNLNSLIFV